MAEVFLARQGGMEGFARTVAVKRILPHLVDSQEFVRMFLDEARLAARLSHPNIVHIYDFGKNDEHFFIAMEFVDGVHAGQIIKHARGSERIAFELVARIGADACAGLRYAHALTDDDGGPLNLVHRDVSPPNLMVSFDGVVKLVDFGIAKAVTSVEHTRPGVIKGKFAYMSPEQCTGRRLAGPSDVFSLGIVLWELLAGRVAIKRDDPVGGMEKIRDGRLEPIETVRPDVPLALARALRRALEVDPERRASAAEFGQALEEYLKGSPEMATSMELGAWVRERFPRIHTTGSMKAINDRGTSVGTGLGTMQATIGATIQATHPGTIQAQVTSAEREVEVDAPTQIVQFPPSFAAGVSMPPSLRKRRSRAVVIGLVAAAAFAVGAIAIAGMGDDEPGAPAQVAATDPEPVPAPAPIPVIVPDAAPPPVPPDAAPQLASLGIITTPAGAVVDLDGEAQAEITPVHFQNVDPGEHTIAVSLDGYDDHEQTVTLRAGERRTVQLQLVPTPPAPVKVAVKKRPRQDGRLTARTQPWATVYYKGKKLGTTPFANIKLPAGTHTLTFKNPKKKPHRRAVVIRSGKTTKLNFELP